METITISQPQPEERRRRRLLLVLALVALMLPSVFSSAMTLALFGDTATVGNNAFTTGAIDIATSPATALVSFTSMMPGDSVTGTLGISNSGTAQLRYAMTTSTTNADLKALHDAIVLDVRTAGTDCATFDGASLYSGTLNGASFGSTASGAQTGDRTLAAGVSETLCVRASLPSSTGDAYQNAATAATFSFVAEQTANNP